MARHNAAEALGADLTRRLDGWRAALPGLASSVRPVETDNRLHAWEWLVLPDGRIVKTDAVDHHAGHDLVGCQDIAWDVAGAAVELAMDGAAGRRLRDVVAQETGRPPDPQLTAWLEICYSAFQLGATTMAGQATGEHEESARIRRQADRYRDHLVARLRAPPRT
jgi:hypothetical protein